MVFRPPDRSVSIFVHNFCCWNSVCHLLASICLKKLHTYFGYLKTRVATHLAIDMLAKKCCAEFTTNSNQTCRKAAWWNWNTVTWWKMATNLVHHATIDHNSSYWVDAFHNIPPCVDARIFCVDQLALVHFYGLWSHRAMFLCGYYECVSKTFFKSMIVYSSASAFDGKTVF